MVLGLMPAGVASAGIEEVCENAPDSGFPDKGATHGDAIDCMFAYDVLDGRVDGTFGTFDNISRGATAKVFVQFALAATDGELDVPPGEAPFPDKGDTFGAEIDALYQLGLIDGLEDGTFGTFEDINRGQFAKILFEAHELLGVEFADDYPEAFTDTGDTYRDEVNALAGEGIITGFADGTFGTWQPITRGAAISLLQRSAGVLDDLGLWDAPRLEPPVADPDSVTDGPELQNIEVFNQTGRETVLRYTFDEPVSSFATGAFLLAGFNSEANTIGESRIDPGNQNAVLVNFPNYEYELATTATVEIGAVRDADGRMNPEAARPLQSVSFDAGETTGPNLVDITDVGVTAVDPDTNTVTFTADFVFDKNASLAGAAGNYILINRNAEEITGANVLSGNHTTTHRVEYVEADTSVTNQATAEEFVNDLRRGYVEAATVQNSRELLNRPTFVGPRDVFNSEIVATIDGTDGAYDEAPFLTGVEFDRGLNRVRYTFNRQLEEGVGDLIAGDFSVYSNTADDESGLDAAPSGASITAVTGGNTVVVQFAAGDVRDAQITGAAVAADAVTSTITGEANPFDTAAVSAASWSAGQTIAPDLVDVEFNVTDTDPFTDRPTQFQMVFVFDEGLVMPGEGVNFRAYNARGQFVNFDGAPVTPAGNRVTFTFDEADALFTDTQFQIIQEAVRAGAGISAVALVPGASADGNVYINYANSLAVSPS